MLKRISMELKVALGCGALLFAACSDGDAKRSHPNRDAEANKTPAIPSVARDKPALASITPAEIKTPTAEPVINDEEAGDAEPEPMPESFGGLLKEAKSGGDVERGMKALELARAKKPGSAIPDIEAARLMLSAGRTGEARPFVEAALDLDSGSSYGWNTMGRVELGEGNLEAAVASFERATEENEDNSYAWNNLGLTLMRLDRAPEAVDALERATSGNKPTGYMWNNLGMAYEHIGRPDLAVSAYRQGRGLGSAKSEDNLERLAVDEPQAFESNGEMVADGEEP